MLISEWILSDSSPLAKINNRSFFKQAIVRNSCSKNCFISKVCLPKVEQFAARTFISIRVIVLNENYKANRYKKITGLSSNLKKCNDYLTSFESESGKMYQLTAFRKKVNKETRFYARKYSQKFRLAFIDGTNYKLNWSNK